MNKTQTCHMITPNEPLVVVSGGTAKTDSLHVAEFFEKRHDNVIRDIENLIVKGVLNFEETPYINPQNGQSYKSYEMDRTGFTLLAMGFTGDKALEFKLQYIRAFDAMEAALQGPKKIPYAMVGQASKDQVRSFKAWYQLGKTVGLSKNQALLKANRLTLQETGRDCLESIGMKCLPIPGNEPDFVPSDLGRKLGGLSGKAVNVLLERAGLQEKFRAHEGKVKWLPTDRGKAYATIKETSRQHAVGTCQQLFWKESVLDLLKK